MIIYVEGNIGVGKSTLIPKLCEDLGFQPVDENVDNDIEFKALLKERYNNPTKGAFPMQMWLTNRRKETSITLQKSNGHFIVERSIISDLVFSNFDMRLGNMTYENYKEHQDIAYKHLSEVEKPELVIYLSSDPTVCYSRVRKRARPEEEELTEQALFDLNESHNNIIPNYCARLGYDWITHDWTTPSKESYLELLVKIRDVIYGNPQTNILDGEHEF